VKKKRGFAVMKKEQQRELAARGGRRAHALGKAHQWTSDTARAAGLKAGEQRLRDAVDRESRGE
jgi:uncharacterized protein